MHRRQPNLIKPDFPRATVIPVRRRFAPNYKESTKWLAWRMRVQAARGVYLRPARSLDGGPP